MQRTVAVIDLPAIRRNALKVKSLLGGAKFFAVVKADAYGHGAEEVSRYIEDIADFFCVAITEEGIALRVAGISKPVLVLTPPLDGYDVSRAREYNLTLTVNSVETASLIKGGCCHIKVNTGMNRHGCDMEQLPAVVRALDGTNIEGIYSHLYLAGNAAACEGQFKIFSRAARYLKTVRPAALAHLSASGGILRGGKYIMDGARAGILLYGYAPAGFKAEGFSPAMKVYARRTQTTRFIGGGIGYNAADKNYKTLATYRCGYADGFFRGCPLGEKTLCMDSFISQENEPYLCVMDNAEAYAARCNTISYEVLTNVTRRAQRIYDR